MSSRSGPSRILSRACSKSSISTAFFETRAAIRAASLTRFRRSAPEKPIVPEAIESRSTSSDSGTLRQWTLRMATRPSLRRPVDRHVPVEAAGTQEGRVEHVGPVGGGQHDHRFGLLKAVHLAQDLVERLFALVVSAAKAGTPLAADRVDFVDEQDAGGAFLGRAKQVADAGGPHADEHLNEFGAVNREEGDARLAGDGPREQRLARSRRAHQQHAFGNLRPEPLEFPGGS